MKRRHFMEKLLMSPKVILMICFVLIILHLLGDGTAVKIWRLSQKESDLINKISLLEEKTKEISLEIQRNYTPEYLERLARERLDMVKDQDIVFVFSPQVDDIQQKPLNP